ncbi:hypothetical protein CONLIGDRAFT_649695 [Coniochaeta ligniaria NRRL 30616]|uniref:Uncharacterized protein n=1 Tax=Coniochaeta ligniaria NRRL 30616 TaxID=1408157 RepID=A0A1J7J3C3_9PEZI|nr:hypothetical protein CONLIGDRAFT_649695 [Coniochaeta ligniaria NRRL 30616]
MKTQTLTLISSLLSLASAAPAAESACAAASTVTCTIITTTITTTSPLAACAATTAGGATTAAAVVTTAEAAAATTAAAAGVNIQSFTGSLGGPPPPVISTTGDRPFSVKGDTFVGSGAALGRSCDVQHNACANAANSGQLSGGVSVCDQQNNDCHASISAVAARRRHLSPRAALDLGSCADTTILFESGLDGRNTPAFIAADQDDFNHGSALNIAVIAGFICQRLDSSCKAGADATAACAQASSAAVAASQDQAAADAFNSIMGAGAAAVETSAADVVATAADLATTASAALVGVQTGIVVQTITSCT